MSSRISRRDVVRGAVGLTVPALIGSVPRATTAAPKISTITDDDGHTMRYAFNAAANPSSARTLVLLHGHYQAPAFSSTAAGWNVLIPHDAYGYKGRGSWWLGEDGDWFVLRLLHQLIARIRARIDGDHGLYFAGSSAGGYGALLHGMLLNVRGVYANAFQSRLVGTEYIDSIAYALEAVGIPAGSPYANLCNLVGTRKTLPDFFLEFNVDDHEPESFFGDHFLPFLAACESADADVYAQVYPIEGHKQFRSFASVIALFEKWHGPS